MSFAEIIVEPQILTQASWPASIAGPESLARRFSCRGEAQVARYFTQTCVQIDASRDMDSSTKPPRDWHDAFQLLRTSQRLRPSTVCFQQNLLLASLAASRSWNVATAICAGIRRQGTADMVTFNSLLKACCASWALALSILQLSACMGLRSDPVTQSTILGSCSISAWCRGDFLLSSAIRQRLRSNVICESARIRGSSHWRTVLTRHANMRMVCIETDQININSAVTSCGAAWLQAQSLLSSATLTGDRETHNAVARIFGKASVWESSLCCLNHALSKSMRLDAYSGTSLLTRPAASSCRTHVLQWKMPLLAFSDLVRRCGLVSNLISWTAAISFSEPAGWRRCLDHFRKGCQARLLRNAVVEISVAASVEAHWRQALSFCRHAVPNAETWTCLARACAQSAWNVALLLHSALACSSAEVDRFYCNALIASTSPTSWQLRLAVLETTGRTVARPDHHAYGSLTAGAEAGEWCEAMELLQLAAGRGLLLNAVMISSLQVACQRGMNWKQPIAMMMQAQAVKAAENPAVCATTIGACGKCGKWRQQLALLSHWTLARLRTDETLYADFSHLETRSWRTALVAAKSWQTKFPLDDSLSTICTACATSSNWELMIFLSEKAPGSGFFRSGASVLQESHIIQNTRVLLHMLDRVCEECLTLFRKGALAGLEQARSNTNYQEVQAPHN